MPDQSSLQRAKLKLSLLYFRLVNLLHVPLVRKCENDPFHQLFAKFVELGSDVPSPHVLEIGSRNVSGLTRGNVFPHQAEYVGFDVNPGEGVNVVGDSHRLSEFLPANRFDLVYTISVFEHLMFPWKVVLEINKVMKTGGCVFVSSHPAWPAHELPWDFWRFMAGSFTALFNQHTGFELVTVSEGVPAKTYALSDDKPARSINQSPMNLCVGAIARKTGPYREDLLRWDIDLDSVTDSMYPNSD